MSSRRIPVIFVYGVSMNYYQFHIGDFNNSTRHLTRVERSVYRDLIDLYYDKELPLTSDLSALSRKVMATSDDEYQALLIVLSEYFTLEDDGYHHERCDKQIKEYQGYIEAKARAGKASAAKRKQNSTRVEQNDTICATNQKPITNNQEPLKNNSHQNLKVLMSDDFVLNETNSKWLESSGMPMLDRQIIVNDFRDYWKLDGSKKTENGWQMAFRRNPIVQRKITNYLHNRGNSNGQNQQTSGQRKLSVAERATEARKQWERENPDA